VNSSQIVLVVVVIVVVAALAYAAYRMFGPRHNLKDRFGDEYDHVIAEHGDRAAGESELRRRLKEHDSFQLRDVTDQARTRYREGWKDVQREFVDDPSAAVRDAEQLVSVFVTDRGYPAAHYDDRLAQLSVEHSNVLEHYRTAHAISVGNEAGRATTEELRQALVHYRELFTNLLGVDLGNEASPASAPLRNVTARSKTAAEEASSVHATQGDDPASGRDEAAADPYDDGDEGGAAPAATGDNAALREIAVPHRRLPAED
jgi:hypothetical protein